MRPALFALLAFCVHLGCDDDATRPFASDSSSDRGTIRGTVVELGTSPLREIADVRVTVEPGERVTGTDDAGRYAVADLTIPAGGLEYRVRASKPGFHTVSGSTVLSPSRPEATVNFQLTPRTSGASGPPP